MLGDLPKPFLFINIPGSSGTGIEAAMIPAACGKAALRNLSSAELTYHALPGGARWQICKPGRIRTADVSHEGVEYFDRLGRLAGREVIALVRNPFERALVMMFGMLRNIPGADEIFRGPSWADDLKTFAACDRPLGRDLGACQVDWLTDSHGQFRCDRILRAETLEIDWGCWCHDWGMGEAPLTIIDPVIPPVPWWEFYDDDAAIAIAKKFARDFEVLDYDPTLPERHLESTQSRSVWIGHGDPLPDGPKVPYRLPRHKRLELPDGSTRCAHLYGALERLTLTEGIELLDRCRRILAPGGRVVVHTLNTEFLTTLLPSGYEDGTPQAGFVRAYVDEHMPEGTLYAPTAVLSHLLLKPDLRMLYDLPLLEEVLARSGFEICSHTSQFAGELTVSARLAGEQSEGPAFGTCEP